MDNPHNPLIAGLALEDWNSRWTPVSGGLTRYHSALRFEVGLFRLLLDGQIMVVGTGTDKSGGMAKRLSDFRRDSDSGRRHYAGQRIHEELDRLAVEVLITGSGPQAREIARKLKEPMIRFHRPVWTMSNAPFTTKALDIGAAKAGSLTPCADENDVKGYRVKASRAVVSPEEAALRR